MNIINVERLEACPVERPVEITMEMLRAGYDAFSAWNPQSEEPEGMLAAVYCAMQTKL
jgi:hypothetical protein